MKFKMLGLLRAGLLTHLSLNTWLYVLLILVLAVSACGGRSTPTLEEATNESYLEIAVAPPASAPTELGWQNLRFERISIKQGLSHNTVNCILQDSKGFMWFGTDDGLNKYDGYSFTVYKHDPNDSHSLSHNQVWALFEDSTGMLWVGTFGGGLNRFDRATEQFTRYDADDFQNVTDEPVEFRNVVWAIDEYPAGVLWIATYGGGLVKFELESEEFTSYAPDPDDPRYWGHEWITAMLIDRSGIIWLGTNSEGIDRFDPATGQITSYRHNPNDPDSLGLNWIREIIQDRSGVIWIGTSGRGLDRFDPETERFTHYRHNSADPHSLSHDYIWSIIEDSVGTLWIGTSPGGLNAFDPRSETFTHFHHDATDPNSLSSDRIGPLFLSQSGILWVGTWGGGVSKSDPASGRFTHYRGDPDDPHRLSDYQVSSLLEDEDGTLWIGTAGGGLDALDRKTGAWWHYRHYPADPSSSGKDVVLAIHKDASRTLWIGTADGFYRFDRQTGRFARLPHNPPDPGEVKVETIYSIFEDQAGILWLGTHGRGLSEFDPATGTFTYHQQGRDPATGLPEQHSLSNNFVRDVVEDGSGNLLIGTQEGLNIYYREIGQWSVFQHDPSDPQSLSHNQISSLHQDQFGSLWVGTSGGGLNRFSSETKTFTHYREQDGLANDTVIDILEDDRGTLWIATDNGLSKFDPHTEIFKSYGANDGLPINEFGAAQKSDSGELFFGGTKGFMSFYPDRMEDNPHVPPVVLTSLEQNGVQVKVGQAPEDLKAVTFRWPDNSFEFGFAALNYTQPENNQHAYMLEGFDRDWNTVGTRRFGRYTNLPGGTYTLRLKGSNNDGVWNEAGASIEVVVVPPFWETWWFRGAAVLALVAAGFGAYRLRIRGLEARSRELERQVEGRTVALTDTNIRLYQEIEEREQAEEELAQQRAKAAVVEERNRLARDLHDSVTQSIYSLTLLSEAGQRMAEARDLEQVTINQSRIGDISQQALQEMRLLVYELRPLALETEGLVGALEHRLEVVEKRAGIDARLIVEGEPELTADLEEELYRIAQEALNNALKHAQASTIVVVIRDHTESVSLQVQDDGRGFEPETAQASGGLGLTTMVERAEMINGRLTIRSTLNEGTIVKVEVDR